MSWIEQELKQSLRRRPAPPDFTQRVMARAAAKPTGSERWRRWLAAAAVVLMMTGGPFAYRRYEQRVAAREATRELLFALELTRTELAQASAKAFLVSAYKKGVNR